LEEFFPFHGGEEADLLSRVERNLFEDIPQVHKGIDPMLLARM
jgi:hypothetical protein